MSDFYSVLDEYIGDADAIDDIRVTVRRLWFYDFLNAPVRLWQGQGKLFTSDGGEWLGTIEAGGADLHQTPAIQDGRDGSSPTYTMTLSLFDIPGHTAFSLYNQLKADQSRVAKRKVYVYLVIFKEGEALRPDTPKIFLKELIMNSPKFSERLEITPEGTMRRAYQVSVSAKDNNFGRSNKPNGTYADTIQKHRASELGVAVDRGAEFLALLANRTYQIP